MASSYPAGGTARYAVWVWLAGKVNGTAKVSISAKPGTPSFTVCAVTGGRTCSVALTANQAVELQAAVTVPTNAAGAHLTLTATGTSPQGAGASASGSVLVTAAGTPVGSPSGGTTGSSTPGVGVLLPGALPGGNLPLGVLPSGSLPLLPTPVTDPGLAFPQVSPTPDPSPVPAPLHVSEVSAAFPLSTRLVGGQIVGLAVLAAAVTIAVARLSLRTQRPPTSQKPTDEAT